MAQEILVKIITDSSGAVKGLSEVNQVTKEVAESQERLGQSQGNANKEAERGTEAFKEYQRNLKNLKKTQDPLIVDNEKLKIQTKENRKLANERAQALLNEENGIQKVVNVNRTLSKSFEQVTEKEKRLLIEQRKQEIQLKINKTQVDLLAKAEMGDARAKEILAAQTGKLTKVQKQGRAQSGLTNAILLESGRLASDASFGFTAIANNLSQVITLFQSFARTNGGLVKSLKTLGASLLGSGGVMIAIQLLISFGPKLFKFFSDIINNVTILTETFKKASEQVLTQNGNFETYIRTLQDATKSQEEQNDAIKLLNKEFPDFIKQLKESDVSLEDVKNQTEAATTATDLYRESIKKLAMSEAARSKISELQGQALQVRIDRETKARENGFASYEDALIAAGEIQQETNEIIAQSTTAQSTYVDTTVEKAKEIVGLRQDELDEIEKNTKILLEYVDLNVDADKKVGSSLERRIKQFKAGNLDFEKETIKSQERLLASLVGDEKARLIIAQQSKISQLKLKKEQFEEQQKIRIDAFEKEADSQIAAERRKEKPDLDRIAKLNQSKLDARLAYNKSIEDSEQSLSTAIIAINKETDAGLNNIDLARARRVQELQNKRLISEASLQDKLNRLPKIFQEEQINEQIKQLDFQVNLNKDILKDFKGTEEQKQQLLLETAELENTLGDLKIKKEEQRFQQIKQMYSDGFGALTGFSTAFNNVQVNNLEDTYERRIEAAQGNAALEERLEQELADKKDKIAKKQFRIEQVAKISKALMDTYQTGFRAFGSQIIIGDPTSPVRAKVAQALAIANGLAQVAVIASQKYNSPNRKGGQSASGPGVQVQAPDFNVVGASPIGQLAGAVGAREGQPVKAYVTGKDIIMSIEEYNRNVNRGQTD